VSKTLLGYVALALVVVAALGLVLSDSSTAPSGGRVDVVAAENFYGDIVRQIGADHVSVTSILSGGCWLAPEWSPVIRTPRYRLKKNPRARI